jgi:hypothetical protein
MIWKEAAEAPPPLHLRIHVVEQRLLERRQRIGRVAASFGPKVRARMGSPEMLIAAVGFGVFLHRSRRLNRVRRAWSLVTVLNAAYASSSVVTTLSSWVGHARATPPSADRPQSRG